jgi:hypothetical protein
MEDEPTAGATNARTDGDAPPSQEANDSPDDTVRVTCRMPRALRDDLEHVVERGRFTDMSEAMRHALRSTFGDSRIVADGGTTEESA